MSAFKVLLESLRETTFTEARNNQLADHNVYSTQKIIDLAESRGDSYEEIGDYIFVKPETQPCEFSQFTKNLFCVSDPDKPDWGNFLQYMKPNGSEFTFIFRKSEEPRNKKKLGEYDVMAAASWGRFGYDVSRMSVEEIGNHLYQKAVEEFGQENMKYTRDFLNRFAEDMKSEGIYGELYSSANRLIPAKEFLNILSKGGVSKEEFMSQFTN